MVKLRIRKDNPSGRTKDVLCLINDERINVDNENFVEIDDALFDMSCINPVLFEIIDDRKKEKLVETPKVEHKTVKKKK